MFLRRIRPQRRGTRQTYWELVESYRTSKGSRLRRVCCLGKLSAREVSGWEKLTRRLDGKVELSPGLFDPPPGDEESDFQAVDVNGIRLRELKSFGQEYLAWTLWRLLGLDQLLGSEMPGGREEVPWPVVAAILRLARFCRPSSELSIAQKFDPHSGLQEILGVAPQQVNDDPLYRGLDQLLPCQKAIEQHLRRRLGELFDLSFDILLYDLTRKQEKGTSLINNKRCPHTVRHDSCALDLRQLMSNRNLRQVHCCVKNRYIKDRAERFWRCPLFQFHIISMNKAIIFIK